MHMALKDYVKGKDGSYSFTDFGAISVPDDKKPKVLHINTETGEYRTKYPQL